MDYLLFLISKYPEKIDSMFLKLFFHVGNYNFTEFLKIGFLLSIFFHIYTFSSAKEKYLIIHVHVLKK